MKYKVTLRCSFSEANSGDEGIVNEILGSLGFTKSFVSSSELTDTSFAQVWIKTEKGDRVSIISHYSYLLKTELKAKGISTHISTEIRESWHMPEWLEGAVAILAFGCLIGISCADVLEEKVYHSSFEPESSISVREFFTSHARLPQHTHESENNSRTDYWSFKPTTAITATLTNSISLTDLGHSNHSGSNATASPRDLYIAIELS